MSIRAPPAGAGPVSPAVQLRVPAAVKDVGEHVNDFNLTPEVAGADVTVMALPAAVALTD